MLDTRLHSAILLLGLAASAAAQTATPGPEGRAADIRAFRAEFMAKEKAYTPDTRTEAEARLAGLEAATATVSKVYFDLELARIVALADNGHTANFAGPRAQKYNRVPIRLVPFADQFYVLHSDSARAALLDGQLTAIDGRPIEQVVSVARTLSGGTPAWRDRSAPYFLESPEQMHALQAANEPGAATYRLTMPDGRRVEQRLTAEAPRPGRDGGRPGRLLYPEPFGGAGGTGVSLLAPDRAVWAYREVAESFRWRAAPELEAVVIELRRNNNAGAQTIASFLERMRGEIQRQSPKNLVLDLRMNGGGDLNTTRDFLKSLPTLVPGRIFVLTSPWTFSAAISSTGYLKQASPERVTIVGEMVGDRLEFWAEGSVITLPNSGAVILYSIERHDYQNGCRGFTDCHRSVVRNPISVPTLAPDIAAPWTLEAYRGGQDPAMEAVGRALRGGV